MKFVDLSEDFFRLLQSYLNNDDYHYFLNSSKQHFMTLKRKTIYFRLNKEKTYQYLTDKNFQSILLSKVEDGWEQIHLRWDCSNVWRLYDPTVPSNGTGYTPTFNLVDITLPDSTNPKMLKIIDSIDKNEIAGNLSHVTKLRVFNPNLDLSLFQHIPDLMISLPSTDFSMFNREHQKRLSLFSCSLLTNVQTFQGIHTVEIINSPLLEDVSALYGIYDLSVLICPKVTNISVLGGHHRLAIDCAYHLVGYESLRGIPNISLMSCDISDLTVLHDAKTIELKQCDKITNVAPIKNAKQIILYQNNHITNIEELSNVFDLSITESNLTLIEILNLRNHRLFVHFPTNGKHNNANDDIMENFVFFPNTSYLTLRYLPIAWLKKLEAGSMLFGSSLQSLTIDCANGYFQSIKGLESIPMVRLLDLTILDISGLSGNRCLDIRRCMGIANISSLADVTILTLENGFGMFDCSGLSKIPRLKVFRA